MTKLIFDNNSLSAMFAEEQCLCGSSEFFTVS